ncbi:right-handed parallel beta-helix repeat-containing protein [Halobellus rarus]|uniref:Nitrous oxide reductase family maturation protein NosD n=1 Tax=Halobellus rarus TaxID=1126237 RepID=A0ABD6CM52_9EURY
MSARPGQGKSEAKRCDVVVPDDESTIQDGVDAADPGDTVCVEGSESPYTEQVIVNKDLNLKGVNDPTIQAVSPESSATFTVPESGPNWEPIVFAFGGTESGGNVSGSGVVDVDVSGFTIDGNGSQPSARRKPAILFRNVDGSISDNTMTNIGVGGKETFGILAYGDSDVNVSSNTVREYERGGIGIIGDGGAHPSPTADIRDNMVTGSTGIGEAWGPNGIQIGYGATGNIIGNEVSDNRYAEDAFTASGIIVFESDGVQIRGNTVTNSDVGIACGSWGWFRPTAENTQVVKNEVREANAGVLLRAVTYDGYTNYDSSVSNTKVINNTISDPDPDDGTGVAVEALDHDPDYDSTVDNNKVIRNSITGFDNQILEGGTGTKIQAIEP